jgi:hypothetical protein
VCIQILFSSALLKARLNFIRHKVLHLENNTFVIVSRGKTSSNSGTMQVPHVELEYDFVFVLQDARDVAQ